MSYTDNWQSRVKTGNRSQVQFENICIKKNINFKPFGIENNNYTTPEIYELDYRLLKQPDYIIHFDNKFRFCEVKTNGDDGVKIKENDMNGYLHWHNLIELLFFISYDYNTNYIKIPFDRLLELMMECEQKTYPDNNKKYRIIPIKKIINYERPTLF